MRHGSRLQGCPEHCASSVISVCRPYAPTCTVSHLLAQTLRALWACMSRMKGYGLQPSSTSGNHRLAGAGAAPASGAPSPLPARSSGAAGGRRDLCHAGLPQQDAGTGTSASSAGSVSPS